MYTVESSIKDTDKLKIFKDKNTRNVFSILHSIKNYETSFYNTNASYTKQNETPLDLKLKNTLKNIRLKTKDNETIDIWDINPFSSEKYIIFCHGISSEKSNLRQQKAYIQLVNAGYGVIAFDYRGRGKSSGIFSQKGAKIDVQTIYEYLLNKNIKPENIGIIGHSLGSAVAADFSADSSIAFTILINPFSKAADMVKEIAQKACMPESIRKIIQKLPSFIFPLQNKFDNIKAVKRTKTPVFLIHTKDDDSVPSKHAQKIYKKVNKKKVKYIELEGNDHEITVEKIECCINLLMGKK